jgi:hypothetical protein
MLALGPQRLAAGHEEMYLRRRPQSLMFTAIEDKQEATPAEEGEESSHRIRRLDMEIERRCD